jgi:hypothetical protein
MVPIGNVRWAQVPSAASNHDASPVCVLGGRVVVVVAGLRVVVVVGLGFTNATFLTTGVGAGAAVVVVGGSVAGTITAAASSNGPRKADRLDRASGSRSASWAEEGRWAVTTVAVVL